MDVELDLNLNPSCVILGKLIDFSVFGIFICKMGVIISTS